MKKRDRIKGYMCATDWYVEIPWNRGADFPEIYRSQAALKRDRRCWKECGIVEVELKLVRSVTKGK